MAILKIYDPILPEQAKSMFSGENGVSFRDIDDFISQLPQDDDVIDMRINCIGGDVNEGWAINDKLRATGKRIIATIEGQCSSMASVLLLAASERRGYEHAQLLIHDPFLPYVSTDNDAAKLRTMADELDIHKSRILDYYVLRTGADRDVLDSLMRENKYVDMTVAKSLGFIQEILPPVSAAASLGANITYQPNKSNMKDKNVLKSAFNILAEALGVTQGAVNMDLKTVDGGTLTIEKESGEPMVGDKASPDGMHKLPDGRTVIVEKGVITQIEESQAPQDVEGDLPDDEEIRIKELEADVKQRDDEIASLKAQIADLEERLKASKEENAEEKEVLNIVAMAGGMDWLRTVASSSYVPSPRAAAPVGRRGQVKQPSAGELSLKAKLENARSKNF